MALHRVHLEEVRPFDYELGGSIKGRMADIGRSVGSRSIGLTIPTVTPGCRSSRRHRHVFQEEILIVMAGQGALLHNDERISVGPGDCFCYRPEDPDFHSFENTGATDLVIWAFGNRCGFRRRTRRGCTARLRRAERLARGSAQTMIGICSARLPLSANRGQPARYASFL
jgi:uncharacterized cupin superfamily protein